MNLLWIDARAARRSAAALVLAGLLAGSLSPAVAGAGAAAPAATLGLCLALAGWLARGAAGPVLAPAVLATSGGLIAGLLTGVAPPGVGHAVLGLACGAALAGGRGGLGPTLAGGLPGAAGAVLGGALAGMLAPRVGAFGPEGAAATLAGAVALGVAAAEVARHALLVRPEPPTWVTTLAGRLDAEARPVLDAAADAHRRCIEGLDGDAVAGWDKVELASLAGDLLAATARAADEAAGALRATVGLQADAGALAGHPELAEARARIGGSLAARRKSALDEAARHAAALTRLAAGLVSGTPVVDLVAEEDPLASTGDELARRAAALERRVRPRTSAPSFPRSPSAVAALGPADWPAKEEAR